jgi:hypothetical protein
MSTIDWLDKLFQVTSVHGRTGEVVGELGDYAANLITYNPTGSGLTADNVQDAIDELVDSASAQTYSEVSDTALSGTYNALSITGFNDASSVRLQAAAASTATINGILAPPTEVNGLIKLLCLPYAPGRTTILTHNSGSASAGNKIMVAGSSSISTDAAVSSDTYVLLTRENGNWLATRLGNRALTFGTTNVLLTGVAPSNEQVLTYSGGFVSGTAPGSIMARMTASNSSTTALTFSANQRLIWNGSTTPSFTYSSGSAIDGATITIFFPASLGLTSFTLSSDLDPTGTVAYAFDSGSAAYRFTAQYLADGPSIVCSLRKVTDL